MCKNLLMAGAAIVALAACQTAPVEPVEVEETIVETVEAEPAKPEHIISTSTPDVWGAFGLNLDTLDPDTAPGEDFYRYVNGAWLDTFEIPADRSRYGSFTLLREKSEQRVKFIIEDLAAETPAPSTLEGKVAAFFNAYMDQEAIEAAGLDPLAPYFAKIAAMETREDLARLFAETGFSAPFGGWVDVDSKQTDQYVFYVNQGGLGLPDRDYYLVDNEKNEEIRTAYKSYLTFLLGEAGYTDPKSAAEDVYALEKRLAEAHWDRAVGRNRNLTYNKVDRESFEAMSAFPVGVMLDAIGLGGQNEFVIRQITPTEEEVEANGLNDVQLQKISGGGVPALLDIADTADLNTWRAYLYAHLLSDFADVLPAAIDEANFEFYGKTLSGQEKQRERWQRGVAAVEGAIGEAVGEVYAARYFPPENKAAMEDLVANLRKALATNLHDIEWMGEETKLEAYDKLDKFTPKIGYTEKFETYDALTLSDAAFGNAIAANEWAWRDMIGQLGEPIDKTEWFMLPQTVNAYYSPNRNEIVFPAAILQPPFFNLSADPAINYGAIGGVIGHEMGHGFDDQGAKSDGDGVLRDWWTDEDAANFKARTEALVKQYNEFCPFGEGDVCVNGRLTLGENIGDLGGLSMAYRAYKISLDENGDGEISADEEAPVLDGLTGDQRFFMAWAQVWRAKYRDEAKRRQLLTDPHSPPYYRVNGVVRNLDEWYAAFDVKEGDALYLPPEQRIRIW